MLPAHQCLELDDIAVRGQYLGLVDHGQLMLFYRVMQVADQGQLTQVPLVLAGNITLVCVVVMAGDIQGHVGASHQQVRGVAILGIANLAERQLWTNGRSLQVDWLGEFMLERLEPVGGQAGVFRRSRNSSPPMR